MTQFCINPLAAMDQCESSDDVHRVISNIVSCFEHILPAINKGIHTLIFDARIEQRSLRKNENFQASVANLSSGGDQEKSVRRLWYMYTRNRSVQADWEPSIDITATSPGAKSMMSGAISEMLANDYVHWLSLGGTDIGESSKLTLLIQNRVATSIDNYHDVNSLNTFLPIYEKSNKHRNKPYIDEAGDYVSAMTLADIDAQKLLLISVPDKDDRIGYHEKNGNYYRFKITRLNIYHGFEAKQEDISAHTLARLHPQK